MRHNHGMGQLKRATLVLLCAVSLAGAAAGCLTFLASRADEARRAQSSLARLSSEINAAPSDVAAAAVLGGDAPRSSEGLISDLELSFASIIRTLPDHGRSSVTREVVRGIDGAVAAIRVTNGYSKAHPEFFREGLAAPGALRVGLKQMAAWDAANRAIIEADHRYGRQARQARLRGTIGSTLVIGLLLIAFCVYFLRAHRLQDRVQGLLRTSRGEAMTDVLTGLANRRALMRDLEVETADEEIVLALFDLNNFKLYNDSFGHPAGDALLARLGSRLAETVQGFGSAYRLGGDEFCMLARAAESDGDALVSLAAAALAEKGEGFDVTASFGSVRLPAEAADAESALRLADQRLYMQKDARRSPAAHEVAAALATVLREREAGLERHVSRVAQRARATAIELGLSDDEIDTIEIAGALHDIGKSAIPDSILNKPGPLAPDEWAFMHAHPAIGERIIASAPSLANVARLVRSTHERIDGAGYPDRLEGEGIPIGARIIFVCDAYDAMTADRPYAAARTPTAAIAELRRCAGSQFDPVIVEAFSTALTAAAETVLPAWVRTYGRDPARDSLPRPPLGEHPPTVALAPASLIRGGGANSSH